MKQRKLDILVPHYHETPDVIIPLLDSIALQQSVPMDEIGVIICHDGEEPRDEEGHLGDWWPTETQSKEFEFYDDMAVCGNYSIFRDYPFEIEQIHIPHSGVSAARNAALDHSKAEYVCWCDCDDMFYNACGFWILFREMETGFDSLVSMFVEETRNPETKKVEYINHEMDSTFVHGKVHRRQYLIDKGIRWNDKLTIHEDSYFNILCQNLSQNVKYCSTPFYLWKWRDASVCRHDPKYILKTYRNMLDSNEALVEEFLRRGMQDKAMFFTVFMIFDAYYTMNKEEWLNQENQEYRASTERRFAAWFKKKKDMWDNIPINDKMMISNQVRSRSVMEGMRMEAVTIDGWLKHIEELEVED